MPIIVKSADGRNGNLDVAALAAEELQGVVTGVKAGLVMVRTADGASHGFSLAQYCNDHQLEVVQINGFNSPDTALDSPPIGMNDLDQSVFYMDGMDMDALREMYPEAQTTEDGKVVVLDSDGLWKTMWSKNINPALPPPTFQEQVQMNMMQDPRLTMRVAGITFLFGLCGIEPKMGKDHNFQTKQLIECLKMIQRNCSYENKITIGKLMNQTTGVDPWKFFNATLTPELLGNWLDRAVKLSTFEFRSAQQEMSQIMLDAFRHLALNDFVQATRPLKKHEKTKDLLLNLKQISAEFIQFLVGLDIMRDLSRTTGLNEWIALNEDTAIDKTKIPEMPKFVGAFTHLLKWMLPIIQTNTYSFAKGKKGFEGVMSLMMMIDECIYSLAGVPDSSAKYKCFMALKKLQTQIETKLSFTYQPTLEENKDGTKPNAFMEAKNFYKTKRDALYQLCQTPMEAWNNTLLQNMRQIQSLETWYDSLPPGYAAIVQSFIAMDAAYDMQPWIDVNHAARTHDPFSEYNESFGLPPPEAGYLAKNSPRVVFNIAETLVEGAGVLLGAPDDQHIHILRNPWLLANLIKSLMVASVNRELGTVEILTKFGINQGKDRWASPDAHRLWEDPELVQKDIDRQVQELMGSMAMEQMAQQQGEAQQGQAQQQMAEQARDNGQPDKAGPGPSGPPQQALPMRGRQ